METRADVVVIGLGVLGLMTTLQLVRHGAEVVALDRDEIAGPWGASTGETRIFRTVVHEGAQYRAVAEVADTGWALLEAQTGTRLVERTGGVLLGFEESELILGAMLSAAAAGSSVDFLPAEELAPRFSGGIELEPGLVGIFDERAGVVRARHALEQISQLASLTGALLLERTEVKSIERSGEGVRVALGDGRTVGARSVLVATGPFLQDLLPEFAAIVVPKRLCVVWVRRSVRPTSPASPLPIVIYDGSVAGWFLAEGEEIKVGAGGEASRPALGRVRQPPSDAELLAHREFCEKVLPGYARPERSFACVIGQSVDGDFVAGRIARRGPVYAVGGCCGRAFKFAPALGEAMACTILGLPCEVDLGPFSASRFGI